MKVDTTRFGPLDIPDDQVLVFPEGLIGFEDCTRYAIVDRPKNKPVWWLQSLDRPEIAFILTDPAAVVANYQPPVPRSDLRQLSLASLDEAELHVMLIVTADPKEITANLLGPLLINPRERLGKQVVLRSTDYSPVHPLAQPAPAGAGEGGGPPC
jgi:flagellar assembly factor FliW